MSMQSQTKEILKSLDGMSWLGRRVLIEGLARSGIAAAQLLLAAGARPILHDLKAREELAPEIDDLLAQGCELHLQTDPVKLLDHIDLLVISPGVPMDVPLVQEAQRRGIPWMGEMELGSRFARGSLFALTGTNGKTTTVSLLGDILRKAGRIAHVCGNVGYPLSAAALVSRPEDVLVAEVSSFQLESVSTLHPEIAAVLNITADHLNRHGNMAQYKALKARIFENQTEVDFAILNHDDPSLRSMAEGLKAKLLWFSRHQELPQGCFVRDGNILFRLEGQEQLIGPVSEIKLPGSHNLENVLAAVCFACLATVPPAVIRFALRSFAGVEHRIEFVRELQGVRYINDSKGTNPDASIKAIQAMSAPTVLIAGGFDKQVSFEAFAAAVRDSGLIRHVVLFGQTAELMAQALRQDGYETLNTCQTLEEALLTGRALAEPGWNLLFSPACASFDQFKDYEHRGLVFKHLVTDLPDELGGQ